MPPLQPPGYETTINCKRGSCIVVVLVKGGGRRGEVASSSLSHEGDGVGKRCGGGGTATKVAGGEAVSSSSSWLSNGLGKDPGERGAGGRRSTMTTMTGGVVASLLALERLRSQLSSILLSRTEKEKEKESGALKGPNNQHNIGKK